MNLHAATAVPIRMMNGGGGARPTTTTRRRWMPAGLTLPLGVALFFASIYLLSVVVVWKKWQNGGVVASSPSTSSEFLMDDNAGPGSASTGPDAKKRQRRRFKTLPPSDTAEMGLILEMNNITGGDDANRSSALSEMMMTSSLPYPNAAELKFLKSQLMNNSKIYKPGAWDGAGIVIPEYKLIFFTQGKVRWCWLLLLLLPSYGGC